MSDQVLARLAALKTTPTPKLKEQWRQLFESEPPAFNRRYLESRLAYRIQELTYGGLKPETVRRLEKIGEELDGGRVEAKCLVGQGAAATQALVETADGVAAGALEGEWQQAMNQAGQTRADQGEAKAPGHAHVLTIGLANRFRMARERLQHEDPRFVVR